jgi:cell fate (sporulation/competence/biofilm development) regulator YmcA (YheA/YmcA/DUF963 family)
MASQSESESTIPIDRTMNDEPSNDGGQLESAGEAILKLLHKAADVAEANSRHALETTQRLSSQLHDAENRIAALEPEVRYYRERSERAEQWLRRIYTEIEGQLIKKPEQIRR